MEVFIETSDPEAIDPQIIAELIALGGFYVAVVNVNEGERVWEAS